MGVRRSCMDTCSSSQLARGLQLRHNDFPRWFGWNLFVARRRSSRRPGLALPRRPVVVHPSACQGASEDDAGMNMGEMGSTDGDTDASGEMADMNPYGDTLYGSEGDDDDCKYHVKWTATPVCEDANVTFSLILTTKADGTAVAGAAPSIEAFLSTTHPASTANQTASQTSPGNYTVGPIRFDAAGQWTVRFHFFETCRDAPDSPHGHAAFYVSVP
jgi:hypothetical protein